MIREKDVHMVISKDLSQRIRVFQRKIKRLRSNDLIEVNITIIY